MFLYGNKKKKKKKCTNWRNSRKLVELKYFALFFIFFLFIYFFFFFFFILRIGISILPLHPRGRGGDTDAMVFDSRKGRNWTTRIDNALHHQESIRSLSHLLPSHPSLLFCSRSTVILQPPDRDVVTSLFSPRNILRPATLTLPTIVRSSNGNPCFEGACSEIRSIVPPDFPYRHLLHSLHCGFSRGTKLRHCFPTLALFL